MVSERGLSICSFGCHFSGGCSGGSCDHVGLVIVARCGEYLVGEITHGSKVGR